VAAPFYKAYIILEAKMKSLIRISILYYRSTLILVAFFFLIPYGLFFIHGHIYSHIEYLYISLIPTVAIALFTTYLRVNQSATKDKFIIKFVMIIVMITTFLVGAWVNQFLYNFLIESSEVKTQTLFLIEYLIGFLIANAVLITWIIRQ
jgi:hypothetical protein